MTAATRRLLWPRTRVSRLRASAFIAKPSDVWDVMLRATGQERRLTVAQFGDAMKAVVEVVVGGANGLGDKWEMGRR